MTNQANAIEAAFALFEPQTAAEIASVATAARAYVEARQNEYAALRNRTYSANEAVPGAMAGSETEIETWSPTVTEHWR